MWKITLVLDRPSPVTMNGTFPDGTGVRVARGERQVTVTEVETDSEEGARDVAVRAANAFLDSLSWKRDVDLALEDGSWQSESVGEDGVVRKGIHVSEHGHGIDGFGIGKRRRDCTVEVSDPTGLGQEAIVPRDAASYFRRARLPTDPFDKFRNLYLAAENIADSICQRPPKNESDLLEGALRQCFRNKLDVLRRTASRTPGFVATGDLVADVVRFLYKGHRCQLNHSKVSSDRLVPYNPEDEEAVEAALPLMEFVAKELLAYQENPT